MSNVKNQKSDKTQEERLENRVLASQLSRKLTEKELDEVSGGKICSWYTGNEKMRAIDMGPC
jgi:bacteriocin-like protein